MLIPALRSCEARTTCGERRVAERRILFQHHSEMDMCEEFLRKRQLPYQLSRSSSSVLDTADDSINVMTLDVIKELEFPGGTGRRRAHAR